MDELELSTRMTDAEARAETLRDIQENLGQFAVFVDMITKGDEQDEV
ncbi:MAG: hypothetical protein WAS27_03530 [Candidatus Saccharimonadales bacterium]